MDISLSALGLVLAAPLIGLVAIGVKLTSPGPIIYRGKRIGRDGQPFTLLKFRTMVEHAEFTGGSATANDDVRLTAFGKRIRRWKFDELPQLWNVLVGDMSFVGPRPEVEKYAALYTKEEQRILELRPGLTDWSTIWNSDEGAALAGYSDAEKTYEEFIRPTKIRLQLLYCDHHSLAIDLKIIWNTVIKLLNRAWVPAELAGYGTSVNRGVNCGRAADSVALVEKRKGGQSA